MKDAPAAPAERLSNGATVLTDGSVQVTTVDETGAAQTTTFSKPVVTNVSREPMTEVDAQWVADFKAWVSNNPNYANYLTPEEVKMVEAGNLGGIYKQQYYGAQQAATRESLTK